MIYNIKATYLYYMKPIFSKHSGVILQTIKILKVS